MGFFKLRYCMLLIVALTFDALQFLLGVVIVGAFTFPGAAGAILGCAIGANSTLLFNSCWLGGLFGSALHLAADFFTGGLFQGFLIGLGSGIAAVVDFCFSAIGIAAFSTMLLMTGMITPGKLFSWRRSPFFLLKIIPGVDMLPFFTAAAVVSILECEAESGRNPVASGAVAALATAGGSIGAARASFSAAMSAQAQVRGGSRIGGEISSAKTPARAARTPLVQTIRAQNPTPARPANDNEPLWAANDNEPLADASARQTNTASLARMREPLAA